MLEVSHTQDDARVYRRVVDPHRPMNELAERAHNLDMSYSQ